MKLAIIFSIALSANAIESNVRGIRKLRNWCNAYCENYKPPTISEVVCKRELCNSQAGLRGATDLSFVASDANENPDSFAQCYEQCASASNDPEATHMCVSQKCAVPNRAVKLSEPLPFVSGFENCYWNCQHSRYGYEARQECVREYCVD
eukprot:scaffold347598_cov70-Cyclotella_meneghiniana.AAC.3